MMNGMPRQIVAFCAVLLTQLAFYTAVHAKTTIYYCNPDSSVTDYAGLKQVVENYLAEFGDFELKPYRDVELFETVAMTEVADGITVLPSWFFHSLKSDLGEMFVPEPVWVGSLGAKNSTARMLVSLEKEPVDWRQPWVVATSIPEAISRDIIEGSVGADDGLTELTVKVVNREGDALMAVIFGAANAALVAQGTIDAMIPKLERSGDGLYVWLETGSILQPFILADPDNTQTRADAEKIFARMDTHPRGKEVLALLGLSGWERIGHDEVDRFYQKGERNQE